MDEKQYLEDKEIDLSDLIYSMAMKWRSLIVVMLIAAMLGVGYSLTKSVLPVEVEETRMVALHTTRQQLARQYAYMQESPLMQMDPLNAYDGHVKFVVSAGEDTAVVVQTYLNLLELEEVQQRLLDAAGLTCDTRYTSEVFSAWTTEMNVARLVDKNITTDITLPMEETLYRTAITFKVTGKDRDTCLKMMDAIRVEMESHTDTLLSGDYPEISMLELSSDVGRLSPSSLLTSQQENNQTLEDMTKGLEELMGEYEAEELDAYDELYPDDVLASMELKLEDEEAADDDDDSFMARVKRCIKYALIMAVVGAFAWAAVVAVKYLVSDKIHTGDELHYMTGLPLLGVVAKPTVKRHPGARLDAKIIALRNRSKVRPVEWSYLAKAISTREEKNILLVGDLSDAYMAEMSEHLSAACANLGAVGLIQQDAEALAAALNADGVILLVERNVTDWSALRHEINVCCERKIPMLGAVMIR